MKLAALVSVLAVIAVAGGCDDHADDEGCGLAANCTPDLLAYEDGLTVAGATTDLSLRIISATPAMPDPIEENTWTVEVLDASMTRVTGASITLIHTWSIDCGHFGVEGTSGLDLTGIDNGDGTYTFSYLYAHGGPWQTEIDVDAGGKSEHFVVGFCLPETGPHTDV